MKINYLNLNFTKTTKFFISALLCLTFITSFTSCSDDDNPVAVNEEELITDVTLTFTNKADASDKVVLSSVAPEGQDGNSIETITGKFTTGATYSLTLSILNKTENPADDVLNDDVIPEGDEHFFVYGVNGINLTMTRDASDIAGFGGKKLGIKTTWVAGAVSTGNIQIKLVHEPATANDTNGFGSVTGGSPDFDITFSDVVIQDL